MEIRSIKIPLFVSLQHTMETKTLEKATSILADLHSISQFYRTHRFSNFIQNLQDSIQSQTPLEIDQYRQLISECTSLSHDLCREFRTIMDFIRQHYQDPENRAAPKILRDNLSEEKMEKVSDACDRAESITAVREKLVEFAMRGSTLIAPNLFAYIGSETAVRLVSAAGGLEQLSSMSVPDVLLLGTEDAETCYVERSCLFGSIPSCWRRQARNVVANKVILAARADWERVDAGGGIGRRLAKEVSEEIDWWEKRRNLESMKESFQNNIGLGNSRNRISVVRDEEYFKMGIQRRRLFLLRDRREARRRARATEESLVLALEGIGITDEEKNRKDSGSGR